MATPDKPLTDEQIEAEIVLRATLCHSNACPCSACRALRDLKAARASLRLIQSLAGNPDPAEACRLIIKEAQKALGEST